MRTREFGIIGLSALIACGQPFEGATPARNGPPEAEALIDRVLEAHGSQSRFDRHEAFRFDHALYMTFLPEGEDRWWVASQVVERGGDRRSFQEYGKERAILAFDGRRVWTRDWAEANPPAFMVYFDYYFLFLPWLARDGHLQVGDAGAGRLPTIDKDLLTVRLTFDPDRMPVGKTPYDYFVMYIDPDDGTYRGVRYGMGYEPFIEMIGMEPGEVFGYYHIFDQWVDVQGLRVPSRYHTVDDEGSLAGDHVILNYEFGDVFDSALVVVPHNADVDVTID